MPKSNETPTEPTRATKAAVMTDLETRKGARKRDGKFAREDHAVFAEAVAIAAPEWNACAAVFETVSPGAKLDWPERLAGMLPIGVDLTGMWSDVTAWLRTPFREGLTPVEIVAAAQSLEGRQKIVHEQAIIWATLVQIHRGAARAARGTEFETEAQTWVVNAGLKLASFAKEAGWETTLAEEAAATGRAKGH